MNIRSGRSGNGDELRILRGLWTDGVYNAGSGKEGPFDRLREECGVFGVYGHPDAATLCYYGLHALQHRGEESAGICSRDGTNLDCHRGMGLVREVFDRQRLAALKGDAAIGHVRYSTAGASTLANAQPLVMASRWGTLAVCTNGNLVNAPDVRRRLQAEGAVFKTTSDTETVLHLIAMSKQPDLVSAVKEALCTVVGGFAFLIMTEHKLFAAVDPNGLRPLVMGNAGGAVLFASETCALEAVGASPVREVMPGELLVLDEAGLRADRFAPAERRALCAMEFIYFSRPDSDLDGVNLHAVRKRMGKELAKEAFVDADVVTGVPDSSISAAIGYAEQTGIPYELGLIKNRYSGRTFIQPSQELREQGVKMKLSAVRKVVEGKRVVMVDDSIVRGTTSRRIVRLLRDAGAREVHVRIASPPYMNPCFYGIDTPTREELIASSNTVEEIRRAIGADSLYFLSKEGLLAAIGRPEGGLNFGRCTACFDRMYPTPVPLDDEDGEKRRAVGCAGGCSGGAADGRQG